MRTRAVSPPLPTARRENRRPERCRPPFPAGIICLTTLSILS
jgi:hypothetical protein